MRFPGSARRGCAALISVLMVATAAVAPAAAQTAPGADDSVAVVKAFVATVNTGDIAAQLDYFTDDAIVIGGPCGGQEGAMCLGKAQIEKALHDSDAVQVTLAEEPTALGDGNVVQVKVEERFSLPPSLVEAGVHRYVETGHFVVQNGKIARIGLVADVTDAQTVTALRAFAAMGPEPGGAGGSLVAEDGQSLANQPLDVQQQFIAVWGDQAAAQWASQHNAALAAAGR